MPPKVTSKLRFQRGCLRNKKTFHRVEPNYALAVANIHHTMLPTCSYLPHALENTRSAYFTRRSQKTGRGGASIRATQTRSEKKTGTDTIALYCQRACACAQASQMSERSGRTCSSTVLNMRFSWNTWALIGCALAHGSGIKLVPQCSPRLRCVIFACRRTCRRLQEAVSTSSVYLSISPKFARYVLSRFCILTSTIRNQGSTWSITRGLWRHYARLALRVQLDRSTRLVISCLARWLSSRAAGSAAACLATESWCRRSEISTTKLLVHDSTVLSENCMKGSRGHKGYWCQSTLIHARSQV